jgi:flagellar biosynthesis activator protein FlaF
MFSSPSQAYDTGGKATLSTRELEAAALYKCARQMEAVRLEWEMPGHPSRLAGALRFNQRLWTLFQTELETREHPLPVEVRANLLQIIRFVDRRTYELLADPDPRGLQALIDINRTVAEGLATRTPG